jgi:biofilm protein TabA
MKKTYKLICLAIICFVSNAVLAQSPTKWTKEAAHKWVNSGEWRNGVKLKVYAGIDEVEFAKQYHSNKAIWDKAFAFIHNTNLDTLKPGKHVIDGENVYANVTDGPNKDLDKTSYESHRNYIDLQYVIRGKEKIGVTSPSAVTVTQTYDAASDMLHYTGDGTFYTAEPDTFFLFFPNNAHRPSIKVDGYDKVKKLVIKIRVAN